MHIADDTQVGYAEYGSKLIFVDGNDIFALFHTRQMLYSSRYAARQVQLGTHGLTRLPHLSTVVDDACVDHSTRGTHLGTYLGGSGSEFVDPVFCACTASSRYYQLGFRYIGYTLALFDLFDQTHA